MSVPFREGIETQPENLLAGAAAFREALAEVDLAPLRDGTIVFSGIGASWYALLPAVRELRRAGRRAFAVPAPELAVARGLGDAYVLVSQSGASTEMLAAAEALEGGTVYAVSAYGDGPLARAATAWLPIGPLADTAVSTRAYTGTLQALGLLSAELTGTDESAWEAIPELAAQTLERNDVKAAAFAEQLARASTLDSVGGGGALASAGETALLVREALRLPASSAETRQYLHGPLEAVGEGFCCVLFGAGREVELAHALTSFGATVCAIGAVPMSASEQIYAFRIDEVTEPATPILQILPVQLAVSHAAGVLGLPVERLRREQPDTKEPAA
jgi:glucosamine--fructose-6-phosphate aminotransferase (isomerizing)